jgi:hypothetical protein
MLRIPKSKSRKWKIAENYVWLMRMIMDIWGNSWVMWDNFGARRERSHGNKRKEVSEAMREIIGEVLQRFLRFSMVTLVFSGENVIYSLLYAVILHKKIDGLNMKRCRLILLVSFVGCFCCVVSTVQYLTSYKTNSRCLDCIYTTKFSHLFLLQK